MSETDTAPETTAPAPGAVQPVPRKPAAAQVALDQASADCSAFARLSDRMERVRIAFEGKGPELTAADQPPPKREAKPVSHLEGLAFIHSCNAEVLRRMELLVGRFEDLLSCRPNEGSQST